MERASNDVVGAKDNKGLVRNAEQLRGHPVSSRCFSPLAQVASESEERQVQSSGEGVVLRFLGPQKALHLGAGAGHEGLLRLRLAGS